MLVVLFGIGLGAGIEKITQHGIWHKVFGGFLVLATLGSAVSLLVWFMLPSQDSDDA